MNILYLCADRGIPIRGHKGAAIHVRAMSAAFTRAGHQVTILAPRPGPAEGPAPQAELITVPLPPQEKLDEAKGLIRDRQSLAYRRTLLAAARRLVNGGNYDFIYERYSLWSDVGARLAAETRLPLVLEVNAPLLEEVATYRNLSNYELAAGIEGIQFKAAAAISVVSQPLKEYVVQKGASPRRVHVLPNGVDPAQFHPAVRGGSIRNRYGLNGRIVVGFAGRARPWHDLDTLLSAVSQLYQADNRYHLLLVGQMPDDLTDQLERQHLTQAVTVTGPVPHPDIPTYLAAMDVAVSSHLPLPNFYFSPLKLFEYLACGVPTVAADVGQPSAIIKDGETGGLYQPGDAISLAEQIKKLVVHPALARQVAWQGAVEVLQNHTWDKNAECVVNWLSLTPAAERTEKSNPSEAGEPVFPILDRKLRQRLYRATRPDLAKPFLSRHLPMFGKKGCARLKRIAEIELLKYKPGRRCVLAYQLDGRYRADGRSLNQKLIGKVFRDDRGLRLHKLQKMLWHNGFGSDASDGIYVPDSLAFVPEMRMQIQAYAPGETLNELVTETDIAPFIPLAARGLAKLHNLPVPIPANGAGPVEMRSYLLGDELKNLERFTEKILAIRPQSSQEIFSLHQALTTWAEKLPTLTAITPIHRDFYYSQVLFHQSYLTLIDFDLFALGDPAVDVANFTAHLTFLAMDKLANEYALIDEELLFLETYARCRPMDDSFSQRLAFYHAATFYRLLNVVAPRPGLQHLFDPLLRQTAACLEVI